MKTLKDKEIEVDLPSGEHFICYSKDVKKAIKADFERRLK